MRHTSMKSCLAAGTSVASLLMCSAAVHAQEVEPTGSASEIIVTAGKREANVQDVPASIGVVSGDDIGKNQVVTFADLSRLDPAVQFSSQGVGNSRIIIRGIQSGGAATVATYLDEAVITGQTFEDSVGGAQADIGLHDIARVEILKGPQGTLFGASAMAGAVRIITNKPKLDSFGGSVMASGSWGKGTNGLYNGEAVFNAPLVKDQLGVRVVGWISDGGGYVDNIFSGRKNGNDQHVKGVRGTALWRPTENFSLTATGIYQRIKVDGSQRYLRVLGAHNTNVESAEVYKENLSLYSLVGEYDLGFGSVTAATSYIDRNTGEVRDTTPFARFFGLPGSYSVTEPAARSTWSSELRFASKFDGPLQIVAGAAYQRDKNKFETVISQVPVNSNGGCLLFADCVAAGQAVQIVSARNVSSTYKSWAFFGEGQYKLSEQFTLTAGVRYFKSNQHNLEFQLQSLRPPFPFVPVQTAPVLTVDLKAKSDKPSFNFAAAYEPSSDLTFYARVASGFRQGGVNNAAFASNFNTTIPATFAPDEVWNYEAGVKGVVGNGLLRFEAAYFHIDWSNQQVPAISAGGAFTFTANAGKSKVDGFEFEGTLSPAEGLSLNVGATYTDSRLSENQPATGSNDNPPGNKGDPLPYVSKWGVTAGIEFERPAFGDWQAYARANMSYKSRAFTYFNAGNPFYRPVGDYLLADIGFGIRNDRYELGVTVQNLTDNDAILSANSSVSGYNVFGPRPRTVGVVAKASF